MNLGTKVALLVSGLALVVSPAVALASGAPSSPGAPDNQGTQTAAANRPSDTGAAGAGREPAGEGEGLRPLLPEPEQNTRRRPEGHTLQPVRDGDGEARERFDRLAEDRVRGDEQAACLGPEGHAVQQLRGRGREAAQEPAQEPLAQRYGSNPNENPAAAGFSVLIT